MLKRVYECHSQECGNKGSYFFLKFSCAVTKNAKNNSRRPTALSGRIPAIHKIGSCLNEVFTYGLVSVTLGIAGACSALVGTRCLSSGNPTGRVRPLNT